MVTEENKTATAPPYISSSTFITFLDWIRDFSVTPSHIDRSLWGEKFGGSVGVQLMAGLKFLGLLKGEEPTEKLEVLARASNQERKKLLGDLLREVYGEELVLGLNSGTPKRLDEGLKALGATTSTHDKARSFFVNVAKVAEVPIMPSISKKSRVKKASGTGMPKVKGKGSPPASPVDQPTPPIVELQGQYAVAQSSLLLWGMFTKLPEPGTVWGETEREAWKAALEHIFSIEYRVESDEEEGD